MASKKSGIGTIKGAAEDARQEAVATILARPSLRNDAKHRIRAIDKVCKGLAAKRRRITVANVVRELKEQYPQYSISESTVRNNTNSGRAYREVISAWANHEVAVGAHVDLNIPQIASEDLTDASLAKIKPDLLRLQVQAMRTALRNYRRQLQMLQAVSANKLIYHGDYVGSHRGGVNRVSDVALDDTERDALLAMLDKMELATRGLRWSAVGQLIGPDGTPFSRPGLRQAIERTVGARLAGAA